MNNSDKYSDSYDLNENFSSEKFDEMDELALSLQKQIKDLDSIPELDDYLDDSSVSYHSEDYTSANQTSANQPANNRENSQQASWRNDSLSERQTESLQQQLQNQLFEQRSKKEKGTFSLPGMNILIPSLIGLFFIISFSTYWLLREPADELVNKTDKISLSLPDQHGSLLDNNDNLMEVNVDEINEVKALVVKDHVIKNNADESSLEEKKLIEGDVDTNDKVTRLNLPDKAINLSDNQALSPLIKIPLIYLEDKQSIQDERIPIKEDLVKGIVTGKVTAKVAVTDGQENSLADKNKGNLEIIQQSVNKPVDVKFEHNDKLKLVPNTNLSAQNTSPTTISEKISKIMPSPVIGNSKRQWIDILGSNFNAQTHVILHWKDKGIVQTKAFSTTATSKQFEFINSQHLRLHINTGVNEGIWQIQLKNKDKISIDYQFKVVKPFLQSKQANVSKKTKIINSSSNNYNQYIKSQPDKFFTLQLLGSSNENAIKKIVNKHKSHKDLYWYKSLRDGKNWTILMYGSYDSKLKAQQAYSKLPKSLALTKPWVREIKDVKQQLLNKFDRSDVVNVKQMLQQLDPVVKTRPDKQNQSANNNLKNDNLQSTVIRAISPDKWAFQLISLSTQQSMLDYISHNKLSDKGQYFIRSVNGKERYTLIYGIYNSKQQAEAEFKSLPFNIRQGKPWIRSYADIHKLMGK